MPPEDLRNAIRSGDLAQVASLLKQHPDLSQSKERRGGATLLHGATFFNQSAIANYLLEHGAVVDAGDRRGCTALAWAASKGHKDMAELLLSRGANAKTKDQGGFDPLYYAATGGHSDIAKLLQSQGANIISRSNDGWTALHTAAYRGHLETVQWLVENGAELDSANSWGQTPLFWAVAGDDGSAAAMPPRTNGDKSDEIEVRKATASTASKKAEVAKFLLANGANINASDELGETPLYCAAYAGDLESTRLLLAENAMMNEKTKDGWTALCVAAKRGHSEVVKLLLDRGADPNIKVKEIYTPFNYAVQNGRKEAAELLFPEASQDGKTVKARCTGCGSKKQLLINAPLFVADKETREIFRCTGCGAIWSKRKIELRGSLPGWFSLLLATLYGIEALHDRHGMAIERIALAACWTAIGISHFMKSSKKARTWIKGAPQLAATN